MNDTDIAIVGMAIRCPGATDLEQFWDNLCQGVESVSFFPRDRVQPSPFLPVDPDNPNFVPAGGVLDDIDMFDAAFFGISRAEAELMDPQHRLFLQCVWHAMEDAGEDLTRGEGSVCLYAGSTSSTYGLSLLSRSTSPTRSYQAVIGSEKDFLATRVSYKLNLTGESVAVQTACSTSLVAVHLACQSILSGQSDVAIAGGVAVQAHQRTGYVYDPDAIFSPDGHTRAFDESARGTVFSNGLGAVVLKPLRDAVRDRNRIYAVIKGTAVNNDATTKVSYTAPSVDAQAAVVAGALEFAGVPAETVGYVEAHGTGTPLGDPIEVAALTQAFRQTTDRRQFCALGSVKTNIGHLDVAAGVAGLIKTALSLWHGRIPASLHFKAPNPSLGLPDSPFYVNTELREWPATGTPRRAGVSSFGIGGTNSHVVLEEAPTPVPATAAEPAAAAARAPSAVPERRGHLLTVTAKSREALGLLAARHLDHLTARPDAPVADYCFTANDGRAPFAHRLAVVGSSARELCDGLRAFGAGAARGPEMAVGHAEAPPVVAFMFTGQGGQYPGMGDGLYRTEPAFRRAFDACQELMGDRLDEPLRAYLDPEHPAAARLREPRVVQPALFALEYALAQTWLSWGVRPDAVIGHSLGEYVAACVAGVLDLPDAVRLVAERGRLMHEVTGDGAMLAVFAAEADVAPTLEPYLDRVAVAAVNGPRHTVLSGQRSAVERLRGMFEAAGTPVRSLAGDVPFHSPLMDPVLPAFRAVAETVRYADPRVPLVSGRTGRVAADAGELGAEYWTAQLREPVLFGAGLAALVGRGAGVFLEVGPHPTLSAIGRRTVAGELTCLSSLHRERDDWRCMLAALGGAYVAGVPVDWKAVDRPWRRRRVTVPGYAFTPQRYWLPEADPVTAPPAGRPARLPAETRPEPAEPASARPESTERASTRPESTAPVSAGSGSPGPAGPAPRADGVAGIVAHLRSLTAQLLRTEEGQVDPNASLLEVGLDSLVLIEAVQVIEKSYGVRLTVRQLLTELTTLEAIAAYLHQHGVRDAGPPPAAETQTVVSPPAPTRRDGVPEPFVPYRPITVRAGSRGSPRALARLVAEYTARTPGSKRLADTHRPVLADNDNRVMSDFRMAIKEMVYPIVVTRSRGSRLWDVDGNEYVDVMMGYGVNLFGHSPAFVTDAVREQLERGVHIGGQSERAGEVAGLLSELTGAARVAFCNSGSEAVMTALRLARAVTGRTTVAMFAGSYHGIFDGTLGSMRRLRPDLPPAPVAPGIPQHMVDDLLVLPYDDPAALETLRSRRHELAAVLVEPVQSRRPDIQPREFLHELRRLTSDAGVALIFDEIVTGLRTGPGGAQDWFGVRADLATYGKVLGGGLPIGAVAGQARFLDAIDGGVWRYGDDSYPSATTTFFAGTFCKHPLAMAAASAVLTELKRRGPALQQAVSGRTAAMVDRLNEFFTEESVPIRMAHFGSLFRFFSTQDIHLLYYHLVHRGVHAREGHNAFLSDAHTDADVDLIVSAVQDGVAAMRGAGLLPAGPAPELRTRPTDTAVEPAAAREPAAAFPLTAAQRQLWILAGLDPEASVAYHQTSVLRLHGDLDLDALRDAVRRVGRRHDALRTVFDEQGGWQRVQRDQALEVTVVPPPAGGPTSASGNANGNANGSNGNAPTDPDDELLEWVARLERRPFDLSTGPLIRTAVIPLGPRTHLLVLTAHHIVADGWSVGLMLQEIGVCYSARVRGAEWAPPEPVQFRAYVESLTRRLAEPDAAGLESYWTERMRAPLPVLDLPLDRARPAVRSHRGARHTTTIDPGLLADLHGLGARTGATLFTVLLSAYHVLLHRLTGQRDIVVGVPVAGRTSPGAETTVGHCINLLPIRGQVTGDAPFHAVLSEIGGALLDGYERQDYPVGLLAERLGVPFDPARTPLFSTVFNLDRVVRPPAMGRLRAEQVPLPVAHAQFDVALNAVESTDGLRLEFDYRPDLFDAETIERWAGHLHRLLRSVVERPDSPVAGVSVLSAEQRRDVLHRWNATEAPYPDDVCLHGLFAAQAARTPGGVCLIQADRSVTYAEVDRRSNRLARYLTERGVGPEDAVAVCLDRSVDWVVTVLGVLKAGAAYLPLDPAHPAERLAAATAGGAARLVLTRRGWGERFAGSRAPLVELAGSDLAEQDDSPVPVAPVGPDRAAFVLPTSGSTGAPKAVVGSHRSVVNRLHWMWTRHPYAAGEICCHKTAGTFVDSVAEVFGPLLRGVPLAVLPREVTDDPLAMVDALESHRVTRIVLVPSVLRVLLQTLAATGRRLPGLRHWTLSGEELTADLVDGVRRIAPGATVLNTYGSTEVTADATWHECERGEDPVPIGAPIANTRVYVLDADGGPVPTGVVGEVHVGGLAVTRGYRSAPETAARFVPDPFGGTGGRLYRTGDLARRRADGRLEFRGRRDRQVKIAGIRVEPAEAEAVLAAYPGVTGGAVVARATAGGQRLVAFVVPAPDPAAVPIGGWEPADLRRYLAARLPAHLVPADIVAVPALPTTPSGKVDRVALAASAPAEGGDGGRGVAPATPVEEALQQIWAEVLGRRLGTDVNFFQAGGTSLNVMQLVPRIRAACGVEVAVRDLFTAATIAGMAAVVEAALLAGSAPGDIDDLLPLLEAMDEQEVQRLLADPRPNTEQGSA